MKSKLLLVLFFVSFSLFLFLGIRASQVVFEDGRPVAKDQQSDGMPVLLQSDSEQPPPLDPFTLVILVDDLENMNPLLEGVWLHRATDGRAGAMFFPIFPSQADDGLERDLNLRGAFWLEISGEPSQQFYTILTDRNLNWHQILILDHMALKEIGFVLAEVDVSYQPLNPIGLAGLAYSVENRLNVQSNQGLFIHDLCQTLPLSTHNELLQSFLEGFSGHMRSIGISPLNFSRAWQATSYCLFPTLALPVQ